MQTDLSAFGAIADPFTLPLAPEFRDAFREKHGRYPSPKEWERYWNIHPDQFPGTEPWEVAKKRTDRAMRIANEYWAKEAAKAVTH